MRDYQLTESAMGKLTELAEARGGKSSAADKVRVIEIAIDRMYQQCKTAKEARQKVAAPPPIRPDYEQQGRG